MVIAATYRAIACSASKHATLNLVGARTTVTHPALWCGGQVGGVGRIGSQRDLDHHDKPRRDTWSAPLGPDSLRLVI
jgi:hypothetical protein